MDYNLSEIYKTHSQKILLYLSRFVGKDDAEDLMQDVFVKVLNSITDFKGNSQLSTWIYRIATNTALDKLKSSGYSKEKFRKTSMDYVMPLKSKSLTDEQSDIEYGFLKQEMNQCIADFVSELPDSYRSVFLLREYENFTIEEISEITQITPATVKIRLHRGRKKLHGLLLENCSFYYDQYSKLCCDKK